MIKQRIEISIDNKTWHVIYDMNSKFMSDLATIKYVRVVEIGPDETVGQCINKFISVNV